MSSLNAPPLKLSEPPSLKLESVIVRVSDCSRTIPVEPKKFVKVEVSISTLQEYENRIPPLLVASQLSNVLPLTQRLLSYDETMQPPSFAFAFLTIHSDRYVSLLSANKNPPFLVTSTVSNIQFVILTTLFVLEYMKPPCNPT